MRSTSLGATVIGLVAVGTALTLTAAPASARPIFTPEPGGVIKIESDPGEWWKCVLYSPDEPNVRGLPPVVNYAPGSWAYPDGRLPPPGDPVAPDFATPPAYAVFQPGSIIVADCVSQYLPVFWLEVLQAPN